MNKSAIFSDDRRRPHVDPPTLPRTRWVHFRSDGCEINYPAEPSNVPTVRVEILRQSPQWVDERCWTFNREDGTPRPPRGVWFRGASRDGSTVWTRRRVLRSIR